jgi:sterol desaturase/sphingolipid hydroxylase (fatty acid hydroxylase superfamily)
VEFFDSILHYSIHGLSQIIGIFITGGLRHYWLAIITGLVIAFVVHKKTQPRESFIGQFFSYDAWRSPSAQNDYAILLINPLLSVVLFSGFYSILTHGADALTQGLAMPVENHSTAFILAIGALLTLTLFLVDDFLRWWLHYLQHRIPLLWEFHKVHHSAEVLNFATAERFHPLDVAFFQTVTLFTVGLVNGIFIALWGDHITAWTLIGANGIWFVSNLAGGVLRHSPSWVSFGPRWERWFISPAMHHVHHSGNQEHYDKNFGGALSVWDRWFGTLYIPNGKLKLDYGIGEETVHYRSLWQLYWRPMVQGAKLLIPRRKSNGPVRSEIS